MNVVLMGPPGVGKGTQARGLMKRRGMLHVSTGDILRQAVQSGSPAGKRVRPFVESGRLVPDDVMGELIEDWLERGEPRRTGFILDGFPRTVEQVLILDRALGRWGYTLDRVLMLVAAEAEIVRRLSGRRTCPKCAAVYHVDSRPPASPGICDLDGSALVERADDAEQVVRERLRIYAEQTLPVAQAYRERGILREVDSSGIPETVLARLEASLDAA